MIPPCHPGPACHGDHAGDHDGHDVGHDAVHGVDGVEAVGGGDAFLQGWGKSSWNEGDPGASGVHQGVQAPWKSCLLDLLMTEQESSEIDLNHIIKNIPKGLISLKKGLICNCIYKYII